MVYFGPEQGQVKAAVLPRRALAGKRRPGPAVIQEYDTTIVVPPGCEASMDAHDNVVIAIGR
jgi:N-methylhydantoinase A